MKTITPYLESTALLDDSEALLNTADSNGYLYFRGLLPVKDVLEVRRDVLEATARHGFLHEDYDLMDGVVRNGAYVSEQESTPEYIKYYRDLLRVRSFHALAHHPVLLKVLKRLLGPDILVHPRHICHTKFPGNPDHTTHPHQDFYPVRGTPETWTVWVPLGSSGPDLGGGLGIIPGSHTGEMLPAKPESTEIKVDPEAQWVWGPVDCGDVLMFHSMAIHQGSDNLTTNRIRFAASFRNQATSEPVDESSLKPHMNWITWEEIYEGWESDDPLKFYWRDLDINMQSHWNKKDK